MSESFARSIRSIEADRARPIVLWLTIAVLLLAGWVTWFVCARVSLYEVSVTARFEAMEQAHSVEAPLGGRISAANVPLGRLVDAGDVLVEVDDRHLQLDRAEAGARLEAVRGQISAIEREIAAQQRSLEAFEQTTPLRLEEARARHREAIALAQYTADHAEQMAQLAQRGDASGVERRRAEAEAEQAREAAEAQRIAVERLAAEDELAVADRQAQIESLRSEAEQLESQIAVDEAAIARLEFQIAQQRITAPVAGVIAEAASLQPGRVIGEGAWIATIIPQPDAYRIVADFDASTALGRIEVGQRARVRLTGFPWSQYGTIEAMVTQVAGEVREGLVRAELQLNFESKLPPIPLQHDLPGLVEVEVERISPAEMVLRAAGRRVTSARLEPAAAGATDGARF